MHLFKQLAEMAFVHADGTRETYRTAGSNSRPALTALAARQREAELAEGDLEPGEALEQTLRPRDGQPFERWGRAPGEPWRRVPEAPKP